MKRLTIVNKLHLMCLQEILENYPKLLDTLNTKPSAVTSEFIRETIDKIKLIHKRDIGGTSKWN